MTSDPSDNQHDGIVVVHGIGNPKEFETLQRVVGQLAYFHGLNIRIPIGDIVTQVLQTSAPSADASKLPGAEWARFPEIPGYVFSEIHWSPITAVHAPRLPTSLVEWASGLPEHISYIDVSRYGGVGLSRRHRRAFATVIDDTVWNVRIMRYLLARYRVETDELVDFLRYFLASVQVFAEFPDVRREIMHHFHESMDRLCSRPHVARVHLCAHSLGSVISLLALLEAYTSDQTKGEWLAKVRTLCTFGSPIDLFLPLWRDIWRPFTTPRSNQTYKDPLGIHWLNFVDDGDPIASTLDVGRQFCEQAAPGLFRRGAPEEYSSSGATWPGGAHLDYWKNRRLFHTWTQAIEASRQPIHAPEGDTKDVRRSRCSSGSFSSRAFVVLPPVLLSILTGWMIVFWMESNFGRSDLNRLSTFSLGMVVGTQVFGQVVLGSCVRFSARLKWIGLGVLAAVVLSALGFLDYAWNVDFRNFNPETYMQPHRSASQAARVADFRWLWPLALITISLAQIVLDATAAPWKRSSSVFFLATMCLALALLPIQTDNLSDIGTDILQLALIFTLWWMATLWWRFFVVWTDFVAGREHIRMMCSRWPVDRAT